MIHIHGRVAVEEKSKPNAGRDSPMYVAAAEIQNGT
jgi:hypothetical protein